MNLTHNGVWTPISCIACKKRTIHKIEGFKEWRRRYTCQECGFQIREGKGW